ncbi:hypothetical protein NST39_03145 [Bacillus sp. FSL W8-0645]|uniref:hypothetical protein n=1 Tax=Bacillus sp. FSL W8-0645 TaxID=2954627 RepID=UPI0030F90A7A
MYYYNPYNYGPVCWPKQHCCIYRHEFSQDIKIARCTGSVPCFLTTPPKGYVYEGEMHCVKSCGHCRRPEYAQLADYSTNQQQPTNLVNNSIPKDSIRVQSITLSNGYCMKIISINVGSTTEKILKSDDSHPISVIGNTKFLTYIHPINSPFNFENLFNKSFSGLGSGRCSCWKWSGLKCKTTRYDDDCCDAQAYLNRCDDHCDQTCSGWDAIWWDTSDIC